MKGKGLKIHKTKAGCLKKVEEHRKASKSEATQVPDKNHSDREGHVNRDHEASKMENLHSPNFREREETEEKPGKEERGGQNRRKSTQERKKSKFQENKRRNSPGNGKQEREPGQQDIQKLLVKKKCAMNEGREENQGNQDRRERNAILQEHQEKEEDNQPNGKPQPRKTKRETRTR